MRNFGYDEDGWVGSLKDRHIWQRILRYSKQYLPALSAAVILSLLVTGATLGLPRLMQLGIDRYITVVELTAVDRIDGLGEMALIYGVLVSIVFFASFLQVVLLEKIGQSIMHSMRRDLFSHLLKLDLSFFNNQAVGRLVTRLTNDIQNMHEMFTSVMVTLFNDLLKLFGILVILYLMNFKLALVMSIFVPLSFVTTIAFSRLARGKFRAIRSQLAKLNSFLQESISGFKHHSTVQPRAGQLPQIYVIERRISQPNTEPDQAVRNLHAVTEFMSSAAIALIVWYGGGEVIRQQLTLGELVAFLSYMRLFFQPLRELSQKYSIVQSALASAERIFNLLDKKYSISSPALVSAPEKMRGKVLFDKVSFGYSPDGPVYKRCQP